MTAVCDFIWKLETMSDIDKKINNDTDRFEISSNLLTDSEKFKSVKNYDLGINFTQQEYSDINQFTSEAVISGDTAVLSRGKWPDNCANGRITFDVGKKFFYIVSRESEKKIILDGFPPSGMFSYIIRLTEFDLGEVKLCAKRNADLRFENWSINQDENYKNVINEYVSVSDTEAIPTTIWPKIVSSSIVETINSQNIYYWLIFYPSSKKFNEDIEVKIFNKDKNFWRKIAKVRAGFWEYNNSAEATSETWVLASTNDLLHAVSEAISSKNVNRMTREDVTSITEFEWGLINGWSGPEDIARGLTLHSTDPEENPSVSQFCLNFEK